MLGFIMQKHNQHSDVSAPQSVTEFIKVQTAEKTIQIGFTEQKLSPYAGLATFASFLHWHKLKGLLEGLLWSRPASNNALEPADTALGFIAGILAGAKKLTQAAHLRRDVLLPSLLTIRRVASQSTFSRFFGRFEGAAMNLRCFDPLWHWCADRLSSRPGGYTLDLDTTQLLHEDDHHSQGVRTGHTPRGLKRCFNPLLAMLAEAKLVVGFWLRPGNTVTFNNVVGFTQALLARLPRHVRIGLVRADAGFCFEEWLQLLEDRHLNYIVVGKLYRPVRSLLKKQQHWAATAVAGTEVSELMHQEWSWRTARRLIFIRHRIADKQRPGGKRLIDEPAYAYQVLITNLGFDVPAINVWRRYNGRAGSENVIKELDADFAIPQLCLKRFWSTEAALSLAIFAYNLCVLFQRHLGWLDRVTANTLRFRLFTTGGILSTSGGVTTIRLAVPPKERAWWRALFEKLLSPYPNCNAVESLA